MSDPDEFVGATNEVRAQPKRTTPSAVYTPTTGTTRPKLAKLGPANRLNDAEEGYAQTHAELVAAKNEFNTLSRAVDAAETSFLKFIPQPTYDILNRERLAAEHARKMERVAQGLSPEPPRQPTHGRSPIDTLAAQRPRTSSAAANAPLRSSVPRR